jgi:hypothetical protein
MRTLQWTERDGGLFLDLSDGDEGVGTWLAVRPHPEPEYWRPLCVLVAGEEERELGDGVPSRELAQDAVVKYAIQMLARLHGLSPEQRDVEEDAPWPRRTLGLLWALLASSPRTV